MKRIESDESSTSPDIGNHSGVTGFLPISSSGHLVIVQNVFGLKEPHLFLDVSLHFGTPAIVIVLRKEVVALLKGLGLFAYYRLRGEQFRIDGECSAMARLGGLIAIGLIPTSLIGFFF